MNTTTIKEDKKDNNNPTIYNEHIKNKYLDEMVEQKIITKETAKNYHRIFVVTSTLEESLNKDLNIFTFEELETVLNNFHANIRNTIESYARIISSYLNWSVRQGLSKENFMNNLKPNDFSKYIFESESYFTDKQLRRYENICINFQDITIVRLLFNGVGGKQMSEIRNLKKEHIDRDNNRLLLINTLQKDDRGLPTKYTERYINVDEHTIHLLDGAIKERQYVKRNGDMEEYDNIRPYTDLVFNDYIIRSSVTKTDNLNSPVDKYVIYRRIKILQESLGIENFTTKFIQRSGMIFFAKNIIGDNELSLDDIKIVADRFKLSSYHNLKGFLNTENINKTYLNNNNGGH